MMTKGNMIAVTLGGVWVLITAFNLFGWVKEGFYGGYGILAYWFYALFIPIISGLIASVITPIARSRAAISACSVALGTLVLGYSVLYIVNRVEM